MVFHIESGVEVVPQRKTVEKERDAGKAKASDFNEPRLSVGW